MRNAGRFGVLLCGSAVPLKWEQLCSLLEQAEMRTVMFTLRTGNEEVEERDGAKHVDFASNTYKFSAYEKILITFVADLELLYQR